MPLQATSGAASYDAFGGGAAAVPQYIEDVFSCFLYTGTGATQTITNNIDLSTKGGLTWIKGRSGATGHRLTDTARGATKSLASETTAAEVTESTGLTAFGTTGFTIGADADYNTSAATYVSWTFRKQPKFFDVVTFTSTDTNVTVSHNLGSVPGCIIIKRTDDVDGWFVYHRSTPNNYLYLNSTAAAATPAVVGTVNSTTFQFKGSDWGPPSTATYVAYLFAHDSGGFGLTGTDNVISCGSYTGNGLADGPTVSLGYEPQWLLIKNASAAESGGLTCNWRMYDNMRGWATGGDEARLFPNLTNAEIFANDVDLTSTGFKLTTTAGNVNGNGETFIYIAIRRGPMKVPTSGTSVFSPLALNNSTGTVNTTGFPIDLQMQFYRAGGIGDSTSQWIDRLRGFSSTSANTGPRLYTTSTAAENDTAIGTMFSNTGFSTGTGWANYSMSYNNFRRAPSFFDEVCYTGTSANRTVTHNLGVAPELMIVKSRSYADEWPVYSAPTGNNKHLTLNTTSAQSGGTSLYWNLTTPTASVFSVSDRGEVNSSGQTYVAYLFATCAGVSKVGTYTGNGSSQTINCGFTGGARFVLIKKSSGTGDWMVSDSARGIVSGNDPYLELNNTNAEVTGEDWLDTDSTGFVVNEVSGSNANTSSATYIFLAIA
jgi:hypothetical protein